jgi:hypothetical protein
MSMVSRQEASVPKLRTGWLLEVERKLKKVGWRKTR